MSDCNHHYMDRGNACVQCYKALQVESAAQAELILSQGIALEKMNEDNKRLRALLKGQYSDSFIEAELESKG